MINNYKKQTMDLKPPNQVIAIVTQQKILHQIATRINSPDNPQHKLITKEHNHYISKNA